MSDKSYKLTIEETMRNFGYSPRQGEIAMVHAEFCDDPHCALPRSTEFMIAKGSIAVNNWISEKGFQKSKMRDSTAVLTVGEKRNYCWVIGKYKNYWLKPK